MKKTSSKFHFTIDFGEDLTLEQAEQHLERALARRERYLFPSTSKTKIEDVGIASDRILQVYLPQKDFELLSKRAAYEGNHLGVLAGEIIQKSLSEWEKEAKCLKVWIKEQQKRKR